MCVADDNEVREFIKLVASNIKKTRQEKGISQLELALMIGQKSSAFYANAENFAKDRRFNLEHIYKIAKALDVDVSEFFKK
ncbi:MAG: helix-turn-helix transcriptional regulator [Epsilonproteobacteria bacterium]|nr:helix-turn-helix transcriptional regulator [Campylobacterota bacterium]PIP10936.1 MAG: transcriptional regulator [Sulfurimonas sp. CG23_combo_of_CG06-09_8_20_14_all_36_33]PIS26795.1 MAG: transcriptional regulator [Sulfurimonas sp. CG08_land_8_20_14_0_20_36_33]PIU35113.1 MAG: transcriptional regulator [Sulfurimonas sp. CG07_land_8_20_14_0_80_36_56]PIV03358.1 MAG: transcriptional regulator [Sulfurimonas sp. CG03_land_8_20_14_0_80_36_25]PIV36581.1 MAG: transcriptional regulator [Sulfurimonas s